MNASNLHRNWGLQFIKLSASAAGTLISAVFCAFNPTLAQGAGPGAIQSLASGKCLDLEGGAKVDGPVVIQYDCHSGANQQWSLESAGGAGYRIVSRLSGKCVGIDRSAGSGITAPVLQSACGDSATEQLWSLESKRGGYVIRSIISGRCLDVPGGSSVNGARLVAWKCVGGENQVWRVTP
ncbi:MAG TPA: RICIN domain-containing protein [Burkholderiaceae bacterium]|nr:RICIN domain-containing protein [Burkholderiaceae bacterium]